MKVSLLIIILHQKSQICRRLVTKARKSVAMISSLQRKANARGHSNSRPLFGLSVLMTLTTANKSRRASQQRDDCLLPRPVGSKNFPSVNLTNSFTSQESVTSEAAFNISSVHAISSTQPQQVPTKISLDELRSGDSWNNVQKSPPSSITSVPDVPQLPHGCLRSFEICYFKSYFPWSAFNWNKSQSYQHFPSDVKKEGQRTEQKSSQEFVCNTRDNARGKSNSQKELQGFVPQVRPTDSQRHLSLLAVTQVRKTSNCNVPEASESNLNLSEAPLLNFSSLIFS